MRVALAALMALGLCSCSPVPSGPDGGSFDGGAFMAPFAAGTNASVPAIVFEQPSPTPWVLYVRYPVFAEGAVVNLFVSSRTGRSLQFPEWPQPPPFTLSILPLNGTGSISVSTIQVLVNWSGPAVVLMEGDTGLIQWWFVQTGRPDQLRVSVIPKTSCPQSGDAGLTLLTPYPDFALFTDLFTTMNPEDGGVLPMPVPLAGRPPLEMRNMDFTWRGWSASYFGQTTPQAHPDGFEVHANQTLARLDLAWSAGMGWSQQIDIAVGQCPP